MMKAGIIALFLGAGVLFLQELRAGEAAGCAKACPTTKKADARGRGHHPKTNPGRRGQGRGRE